MTSYYYDRVKIYRGIFCSTLEGTRSSWPFMHHTHHKSSSTLKKICKLQWSPLNEFQFQRTAVSHKLRILFGIRESFLTPQFLTEGKIPISKAGQSTKHAVSPTSSPQSMSEEVLVLRARNKLLTQALAAIHSSSEKELKKRYDLVWFAKYRCKSSL